MIYIVEDLPWEFLPFEGNLDYVVLSDEEGNKGWNNAQDFFYFERVHDCVVLEHDLNVDLYNHGVTAEHRWEFPISYEIGDAFLIPKGHDLKKGYVWVLVTLVA